MMKRFQLVLDVTYNDNGVPENDLRRMLGNVVTHAIDEGLLTGNTEAEVEEYSYRVTDTD
jgi:hypothetical protein